MPLQAKDLDWELLQLQEVNVQNEADACTWWAPCRHPSTACWSMVLARAPVPAPPPLDVATFPQGKEKSLGGQCFAPFFQPQVLYSVDYRSQVSIYVQQCASGGRKSTLVPCMPCQLHT